MIQLIYTSIAQPVEHAADNRKTVVRPHLEVPNIDTINRSCGVLRAYDRTINVTMGSVGSAVGLRINRF